MTSRSHGVLLGHRGPGSVAQFTRIWLGATRTAADEALRDTGAAVALHVAAQPESRLAGWSIDEFRGKDPVQINAEIREVAVTLRAELPAFEDYVRPFLAEVQRHNGVDPWTSGDADFLDLALADGIAALIAAIDFDDGFSADATIDLADQLHRVIVTCAERVKASSVADSRAGAAFRSYLAGWAETVRNFSHDFAEARSLRSAQRQAILVPHREAIERVADQAGTRFTSFARVTGELQRAAWGGSRGGPYTPAEQLRLRYFVVDRPHQDSDDYRLDDHAVGVQTAASGRADYEAARIDEKVLELPRGAIAADFYRSVIPQLRRALNEAAVRQAAARGRRRVEQRGQLGDTAGEVPIYLGPRREHSMTADQEMAAHNRNVSRELKEVLRLATVASEKTAAGDPDAETAHRRLCDRLAALPGRSAQLLSTKLRAEVDQRLEDIWQRPGIPVSELQVLRPILSEHYQRFLESIALHDGAVPQLLPKVHALQSMGHTMAAELAHEPTTMAAATGFTEMAVRAGELAQSIERAAALDANFRLADLPRLRTGVSRLAANPFLALPAAELVDTLATVSALAEPSGSLQAASGAFVVPRPGGAMRVHVPVPRAGQLTTEIRLDVSLYPAAVFDAVRSAVNDLRRSMNSDVGSGFAIAVADLAARERGDASVAAADEALQLMAQGEMPDRQRADGAVEVFQNLTEQLTLIVSERYAFQLAEELTKKIVAQTRRQSPNPLTAAVTIERLLDVLDHCARQLDDALANMEDRPLPLFSQPDPDRDVVITGLSALRKSVAALEEALPESAPRFQEGALILQGAEQVCDVQLGTDEAPPSVDPALVQEMRRTVSGAMRLARPRFVMVGSETAPSIRAVYRSYRDDGSGQQPAPGSNGPDAGWDGTGLRPPLPDSSGGAKRNDGRVPPDDQNDQGSGDTAGRAWATRGRAQRRHRGPRGRRPVVVRGSKETASVKAPLPNQRQTRAHRRRPPHVS